MAKPIRIEADIVQKRDVTTKKIETDNFTSGSLGAGWRLEGNSSNGLGYLEVDNILVRNTLRTHIFQKDVIKATNGQLYVSDSGVVDRVSTGTTTIYFKVDKSATFSVNDQLKIKDVDDSGTIQTITFTISSVGAVTDGAQAYTYSSGVNMASIKSGMVAVRTSGGAVLIDASTTNSPFIDVLSNGVVKARLGNLAGIAGLTTPGYGLWSNNVFLTGKITANSGAIAGWIIDGAELKSSDGEISFDSSIPKITIGDGGQLMVGDYGTNYMEWTGSALNIKGTIGGEISEINVGNIKILGSSGIVATDGSETTFSLDSNNGDVYLKGHIEAGSGTIGGWDIDGNTLIGGNTILNSDGSINLSDKFTWNGSDLFIGDPTGSHFTYDSTTGQFYFVGTLTQSNLDSALKDELKGETGVSISSVAQKYAVSSSNSAAPTTWYDTVQTMTPTNKYLWSYQIITYSDTTTSPTPKNSDRRVWRKRSRWSYRFRWSRWC